MVSGRLRARAWRTTSRTIGAALALGTTASFVPAPSPVVAEPPVPSLQQRADSLLSIFRNAGVGPDVSITIIDLPGDIEGQVWEETPSVIEIDSETVSYDDEALMGLIVHELTHSLDLTSYDPELMPYLTEPTVELFDDGAAPEHPIDQAFEQRADTAKGAFTAGQLSYLTAMPTAEMLRNLVITRPELSPLLAMRFQTCRDAISANRAWSTWTYAPADVSAAFRGKALPSTGCHVSTDALRSADPASVRSVTWGDSPQR